MEKLAEIKQILQNVSSEIKIVQKEASNNGIVSKLKIEKLNKLFDESKDALVELKKLQVSLKPNGESSDVNKLIEMILKIRSNKEAINPAVLQAILSSLQKINLNLGEIRIDEQDHKRGDKTAKVDYDAL